MPLTKSHPMAHSALGGRGKRRKTPSDKHGLDGRFVSVFCTVCGDEGTVQCPRCSGSGEGMVDGSVCRHCYPIKGSGSVPCDGEAHEYE